MNPMVAGFLCCIYGRLPQRIPFRPSQCVLIDHTTTYRVEDLDTSLAVMSVLLFPRQTSGQRNL